MFKGVDWNKEYIVLPPKNEPLNFTLKPEDYEGWN